MTITEKIKSKEEMIKKLEARIIADQSRVKALQREIEQLSLTEIQTFARKANLPITEISSLLEELIKEKAQSEVQEMGLTKSENAH